MLDLSKISFIYSGVDYDYNGYTNCGSYGCDDEGICRCFTINESWVENIDLSKVTDTIYKKIYGGKSKAAIRNRKIRSVFMDFDIDKYFIHRVLTINKIYNPKCWEVEYSPSYYGDEVDDVKIKYNEKLNDDMSYINKNNREKILHLLFREYGHIIEKLENKKWKLDSVDKNNIIFPQKEHYKNVPSGIEYYNDSSYDLPKGIVEEVNGKYKVIDGYHRLKNSTSDVVEVIISYEED